MVISNNLNIYKVADIKIVAKHRWLANYFNSIIKEYKDFKDFNIEPIEF